jgi:hypothetical protein
LTVDVIWAGWAMAQNKLGPDIRKGCLSLGLPPVVMAAIEATTVLA